MRVQPAKKGSVRGCAAWPPLQFPRVADIYALKLEYDCRNRALAHRRYGLASQEALQSARLAEKRDRNGLEEKNRWAEREQSDIESRQRELDAWRDEVLRTLRPAAAERGEPPAASDPDTLAVSQPPLPAERPAEPEGAADAEAPSLAR